MMSAIDTALIKAGLTSDHATCLKKTGHLKKLSKKELLITEGSTCNFFGIVITGTLRSFVTNESEEYNTDFYLQEDFVTFQVEGEPVKTLHAGDAFYEPANHPISHFDNASSTEGLKFVAFYLTDDDKVLIQMLAPKTTKTSTN